MWWNIIGLPCKIHVTVLKMISFVLLHLWLVHTITCTLTDRRWCFFLNTVDPRLVFLQSECWISTVALWYRLFSSHPGLEPPMAIPLPSQQHSEGAAYFTHSFVNPVTSCCLLLFQCASVLLCWRMECWHTTCRNRRVSTEFVCHVTAVHYPYLSCVGCIPICLCFVFTSPNITHNKSPSHVAHLLFWRRDHERKKTPGHVVSQWMKQSAAVKENTVLFTVMVAKSRH